MQRFVSWRALAAAAAAAALSRAPRGGRGRAKKTDKTETAKPSLVASFNDWNVFVGQAGKGRICYALAQPKSREPAGVKRERATPSSPTAPPRACATRCVHHGLRGRGRAAAAKADAKSETKSDEAGRQDRR